MTEARHFVIRGKVQGVSYRASAQQAAERIGVNGWVRNRPDGSVEALAQGDPSQLEAFERWLWQGPAPASVSNVESEAKKPEPLADFSIRY